VPSDLGEQSAIVEVLNRAEDIERSYREQVKYLEQEKRALMQQLLTGKRRVKLPPEHTTPAKEPAS
jgi:type I restriction enzyme S subunit